MKYQTTILLIFGLIFCSSSCDLKSVTDALGSSGQLTEGQVAAGLKEALTKGISRGATELSRTNGYFSSPYKILLPEEAQKVANKLKVIPGFSNFEDELVKRLNRAAEDAATQAKPIFVNAIRSITIQDAWNILRGPKDAATTYLKGKTQRQLYNAFQPKVYQSLNKFKAVEYYEEAVTKYNTLPFVTKVNPRIDDYVTNKALDGLFGKVAEEEKNIRENPVARTTELLKRVFSQQ